KEAAEVDEVAEDAEVAEAVEGSCVVKACSAESVLSAMLPLECCRNIAATCGMLCKVRNIAATFLQHSTVTGLKRIELRASRFVRGLTFSDERSHEVNFVLSAN
ncbi:hypothetical protein PV326_011493, partial [Microctonus aethiopoides]